MLAKKLLYPLVSAVIFVGLILVNIAYSDISLLSSYFVYSFVAFVLLGFFVVVGIPIFSFIYGRKFLRGGKHKILFGCYNSLISILPFTVLFYMDDETYLYSLILLLWCALWTFVPLIPIGKKNK